MDDFVAQKLSDWNLEKYIPNFIDNEVDEIAFYYLNETLVRQIFSNKAGPIAIFSNQWEAWKLSQPRVILEKPTESAPNDFLEVEGIPNDQLDVIIEKLPYATSDSEKSQTNKESEQTHSVSSKENIALINIEEYFNGNANGDIVLQHYEEKQYFDDHHRNLLSDCIINYEISRSTNYRISTERFIQLSHSIQKLFPKEEASTYYIPYKHNKITNTKVLAKGKLWDKYHSYRKKFLECGVIKKRVKKTQGKSKAFVLGYHELLRLKQTGSQKGTGNSEQEKEQFIEEKIQWLMSNLGPWSTVLDYWKLTSVHRLSKLVSNDSPNFDYYSKFKVLGHPKGHELIASDFKEMYPENDLKLYSVFKTIKGKIFKYAETTKNNDEEVKKLLNLIATESENPISTSENPVSDPENPVSNPENLDSNEENPVSDLEHPVIDQQNPVLNPENPLSNPRDSLSEDLSDVVALRLLPLLLPCRSIKIGKKPIWRPSKSEMQDSFFLHITNYSQLKNILLERKKKLQQHGLTPQPLAIAVGSNFDNITQYYVSINDKEYKVDSAKAAIDTTFKSFFALQLQYPKEVEYAWIFFQKQIYKVNGETDIDVPCVASLMKDIDQF